MFIKKYVIIIKTIFSMSNGYDTKILNQHNPLFVCYWSRQIFWLHINHILVWYLQVINNLQLNHTYINTCILYRHRFLTRKLPYTFTQWHTHYFNTKLSIYISICTIYMDFENHKYHSWSSIVHICKRFLKMWLNWFAFVLQRTGISLVFQ